jgi:CRISPR-associated protein Cst2
MMNNKGFITFTVVFEAMSLNRDEGLGNIQSLHLLTRGNGDVHSYMSRQALTYAVRKFLIESQIWNETALTTQEVEEVEEGSDEENKKKKTKKKVIQYDTDILKFEEIDLFGYMKTIPGKEAETRPAAVTFTHAVSMEPYNGDMAFYANHEMVRRSLKIDSKAAPNPYNRQEHKSLYKYSVVIDLNRISKRDEKVQSDKFEQIPGDAKQRLSQLMDAIGSLHHQIAAYREPLYPLFIAAAHIKFGSPIFHNYVELSSKTDEENKLNAVLFKKGLEHAGAIPNETERKPVWAILEGSGDIHLGINGEIEYDMKETPMDVITETKKWIEEIYKA